jgi:FAD/FMN-containing dehydrogenase/Fe-S oxidoreductase
MNLPLVQSSSVPVRTMDRDQLARDLVNQVEGEVRFGHHDRMLYATDASLYQVEPIGVVIPASTQDALRLVTWATKHSVALLPRGGGTSLAGQCTNHAVIADFTPRCREILSYDATTGTALVEPGCTIDDFNDTLTSLGGDISSFFFAADPATSRHASFGGCVGNNAAGARSIRYGRTSENVRGLDVALVAPGFEGRKITLSRGSAGEDPAVKDLTMRVCAVVAHHAELIDERFPKTLRRNAGYGLDMVLADMRRAGWKNGDNISDAVLDSVNLAHLLCGSEGTLAVTLGVHVTLHAKPRAKGLAVLGFESLDAAIAVVPAILKTDPTAVELLDDTVVDLARANTEYRKYVELMPQPAEGKPLKAVLYVEYFAQSPEEILTNFESLRKAVPGVASQFHTQAQAMLNAWKLRKAGEPLLHGVPGHRKPITFVEDNAIPIENLLTFVQELRTIVAAQGTWAAFYAHASVGVLHVRPLIDIHDEADRERMRTIAVQTADLAKRLGGVMSGEHGDGRIRGPLLERFYGAEIMSAMREIKAIFDPKGLLNPGNIVEPRPIEAMTQHLRVMPSGDPQGGGEHYVTSPPAGKGRPLTLPAGLSTYFSYDDQHGFDAAVEMCNGAGVCRKKQGGTMCPSYHATLDERHSTRGRGNALRLAITGQLENVWNDPQTKETLNLCLSCKACKTECPSNVDIARLKAEYAAQGYKAAGRAPFQAVFFGAIRTLNRLGSLTPGLANYMNSTFIARTLVKAVLNIDPRRSLPPFARSLKARWGAKSQHNISKPRVVLFGDCFSMFNEPGIGLAAKKVYEACGYDVVLADAGCCGRAKISLGLLPQAIDEIDVTLSKLKGYIDDPAVAAIIVSEPSCLSAMKDDWLTLKLRSPLALRKALAAKAFLPEQYLQLRWDSHPVTPVFRANDREVLLHGHCHQKALWGNESSAGALGKILGSRFKVLDTGCCGMAGSFGFTCDRFDLSVKIAEGALLPQVREKPDAMIAAPGTSCRHQLHDLAQRKAQHPIEIIADLLDVNGLGR